MQRREQRPKGRDTTPPMKDQFDTSPGDEPESCNNHRNLQAVEHLLVPVRAVCQEESSDDCNGKLGRGTDEGIEQWELALSSRYKNGTELSWSSLLSTGPIQSPG